MPRGGKRPGAGAPKGNMNALVHGRRSRQLQDLLDALAQLPEMRHVLLAHRRAQLRRQRQARRTAAALLALLIEGAPAPPPLLDRLADNQPLFASLLSRLLSETAFIHPHNRTSNLPPPDNQEGDTTPAPH
ncbi:MAG: hypothetical protein HY688_01295 [Chloroflexi bacterium]|nr:hypothetical protein [Chloroflexota bacterium]